MEYIVYKRFSTADDRAVFPVPKSYLEESKAPREFDYLRLFLVELYPKLDPSPSIL